MWQLEYTQEARNYALDSHPYNEDVLIAIEMLAQTANGLPQTHYRQWRPEHYLWRVANHLVSFQRIHGPPRRIKILMIKPGRFA